MFDFELKTIIPPFIFGIGAILAMKAFAFYKGLMDAKRKAEIMELDLTLKSIKDNADKSTTDELIKRANERFSKPDDDSTSGQGHA